jgi:hypothetical protein
VEAKPRQRPCAGLYIWKHPDRRRQRPSGLNRGALDIPRPTAQV